MITNTAQPADAFPHRHRSGLAGSAISRGAGRRLQARMLRALHRLIMRLWTAGQERPAWHLPRDGTNCGRRPSTPRPMARTELDTFRRF